MKAGWATFRHHSRATTLKTLDGLLALCRRHSVHRSGEHNVILMSYEVAVNTKLHVSRFASTCRFHPLDAEAYDLRVLG